jgi:hypothetical protein
VIKSIRGGVDGIYGEDEKCDLYRMNRRDQFGELGVNGMIILKWNLRW